LLPNAVNAYKELGDHLDQQLIQEAPVVLLHPSLQMKESFEYRLTHENIYLSNNNTTDFAEQIKEGLDEVLGTDQKSLIMGLGVTDPKGVFGTTLGLFDKYGPRRVIETPTSENAMTGIGVGLAITGYRPIMVHQRLDFFLLAMDQLVNSAAKWHYMFGGQQSVPLTIRLITGRGWGQGPTHSQNLHTWFTHIPGLKVVMPAFASDAKNVVSCINSGSEPGNFYRGQMVSCTEN